jgi:DNA polymerase-1
MAYRAFFALPAGNFSTTTGQPTNAVYGFTSMLINVLRDEAPTHVAVAFDVSRKTFRTEKFPEYKATRSASPPEFKGQVELIREVLSAMGIVSLAVEGFEADDIIATLTRQALETEVPVSIVTGDRDAFQLVSPDVTVLYPVKGVSELARMTPEAVEDKYGLTPAQYPDFAALRGDPSDNLPGVPGVGEKTAVKWIHQYGSLERLVDQAADVPGKVGQAFRDALPQVLINRELTELISDVPLSATVADSRWSGWDSALVDPLFDALQFRTLRTRLSSLPSSSGISSSSSGDSSSVSPTAVEDIDVVMVADDEASQWLSRTGPNAAVYFVGEWSKGQGQLSAIAIEGAEGIGYFDLTSAQVKRGVSKWLADARVSKCAHDMKGPLLATLSMGWAVAGLNMDTALAAYLLSPGQRSYELSDVAARILGVEIDAASEVDQLIFDDGADAQAAGVKVHAIGALGAELGAAIDRDDLRSLLEDVELPTSIILAEMEHVGIAVDVEGLKKLSSEFAAAMREAETESFSLVGREFNLGSPKQLQEILFGERGLPKTKKIKTGFTTDAEALASLFEQTSDPLLEQLLAWRDRSKLRQTVEGLIPLADENHRIHTTFKQTVAATGRLSSTDPNLQNIPVRTDAGRRIRSCFVVGPGFESLMTADYSQIEMRIMAHASEDQGLIEAFRSGEDLHTTVASKVFGVPAGSVDAEMRRRIKAMSYGLAYGLSPYGLAQQLHIAPDEAARLMSEYFLRFGGVRDYLSSVVEDARATGFTATMLGRRRYLPDLNSDNRQRREMAERMALNAPIQGTAADIVKVAMVRAHQALREHKLSSRLLLQVHDELVLEIAPGESAVVEEIVRKEMAGAAELSVPLDVSVGLGENWESAAH